MPAPIADSARPYRPDPNAVIVSNARNNVMMANFTAPSGWQNLVLSGDVLTVVARDGRGNVRELLHNTKIRTSLSREDPAANGGAELRKRCIPPAHEIRPHPVRKRNHG